MRKNWKGAAAVFAAVAVTVVLVGCSAGPSTPATPATPAVEKGPVIVGSKIDTEGKLLGAIIIAKLKAAGFNVEDKTQTGTTDVVRKALTNGEIDLYPEYTGSGFWFYNDSLTDQQKADFKDGEKGYALVKQLDAEKAKVTWLEPARANNTWALAVKKDFAAANNLTTMSDLAAYVKAGKPIKMAASDEFFNNADAWPAFKDMYGFDIPKGSRIILSGGDTAQTEKAVADGTNGVNVGMAYGTDGALAELGLVVLKDDKGAQLVYWPTPIARSEIASKYPEIATELKPVFDALTLEKLQELNGRIQANGESAQAVAEDFLKSGGFIQ
jgi:osmoprotectant transport system substrate-binding protein